MDELIEKSLHGDIEAYNDLINMILPLLYNIARTRVSSVEDINDIIQETIFKSYKNLHQLKDKKYFKAWIIKILKNECYNFNNKLYRENKILEKIKILKYSHLNSNIEEKTISNLDFELSLKNLNEDEKTIVILYYKYGYHINEIASVFDENAENIKSKLYRARIKIKHNREEGNNNVK